MLEIAHCFVAHIQIAYAFRAVLGCRDSNCAFYMGAFTICICIYVGFNELVPRVSVSVCSEIMYDHPICTRAIIELAKAAPSSRIVVVVVAVSRLNWKNGIFRVVKNLPSASALFSTAIQREKNQKKIIELSINFRSFSLKWKRQIKKLSARWVQNRAQLSELSKEICAVCLIRWRAKRSRQYGWSSVELEEMQKSK